MKSSLLFSILLVGLLGCSPRPSPFVQPAPVQRLELSVTDSKDPEEGLEVGVHHEILAEMGLWSLDGGKGERTMLSEYAELNRLSLSPGKTLRLGMRGNFDPIQLGGLKIGYSLVDGAEEVLIRAICMRRKKVVASSKPTKVRGGEPTGGSITILLQAEASKKGEKLVHGDKLFLTFKGTKGAVVVHSVQELLTSRDDSSDELPMVILAGEARRGFWLSSRETRRQEVAIARDSKLSFSYGLTPRLCEGIAGASLRVTVVSDTKESEHGINFSTADFGSKWLNYEVDLAEFGGSMAEVRFSLLTRDGETRHCPVADVAIFTQKGAPQTVVLISSDTHRGDHLGLAESGINVRTPALDALARKGIFFEDCQSPTNLTIPSHVSLMTGIHLRDHRILDNRTPLAPSARTLAERFQEAGYVTLASVSAPFLRPEVSGLGQGFDRVAWPPYKSPIRDAADTIGMIRGWLPDVANRSVFVWIHLFDAHHPYEPPGEFNRLYYEEGKDPFDSKLPDPGIPSSILPPELKGIRDLDFPKSQYRAEVTYLDSSLKALFDDSRVQSGIVAFVADHGECLGQRNIYFSHGGLYPANLHIPLILSWPGAPGGTRIPQRVTHLDLARTLLNLASLRDVEFPGADLVDHVGKKGRDEQAEATFALQAGGAAASITQGEYHLVLHLEDNAPLFGIGKNVKHEVELYHPGRDPLCQENLVDKESLQAKKLRARLVEWLASSRNLSLTGESINDPALLEKLKMLGYHDHTTQQVTDWFEKDECKWCQRFE